MTTEQLREAYDRQLRLDGELLGALSRRDRPPLAWAEFDHGGFVTYEHLDVEGEALDALIAETVAYFRDETSVASFEWKTRGHDRPADLGDRLVAHGLVAEPVETVMVGRADALVDAPPAPQEVLVRRAGEHPTAAVDVLMDVAAVMAFQTGVFGTDRSARLDSVVASVRAGEQEYWIAEVGGLVVGAGSLRPVPGTAFAGIWGGGIHPAWRGRGIYRALVAARAASAIERGVELIHSDCTDMSRPILERSGLVPVTTTTPYVWTRA
ncbi:MAG: GNAT family N-acetyltransferase [Nocardioides sp.]|uniref:GNAT family N-acetyltransferase n=1 Tax=Nocardioides sp. TaxID=35761 RepID=UPI003F104FCE